MKLKTATLFALIGAMVEFIVQFLYLMVNFEIIKWTPILYRITSVFLLLGYFALILFFIVFYSKQK